MLGMKKINETLFEVIAGFKIHENTEDHDIFKSRAFNRLLRNSNQLMQVHDELLKSYHALKAEVFELEKQRDQQISELQAKHSSQLEEIHSELRNLETQLKIKEIEKENLQRELNRAVSSDANLLKESNAELKQAIETLEAENKQLKDDFDRIVTQNSEGFAIAGDQKLNSKY